ncbi:MAG: hypothetical protein ACR2LV_03585 [Solirubrobacteraceae bacterium]
MCSLIVVDPSSPRDEPDLSELPRYPGEDGRTTDGAPTGSTPRRGGAWVVIIVVVLVSALVLLHLTGTIGAGSH